MPSGKTVSDGIRRYQTVSDLRVILQRDVLLKYYAISGQRNNL